jgi:hypothetical protein
MNSEIFSTFSFVLLVLRHPEHSSSSTDTRLALKCEFHSETAIQLKECSQKPHEAFQTFWLQIY